MRQNTALAIGLNPISRTALGTLTHTCDVIEAEDAEQALPLLQSRIFHIIFLDSQSASVTPRIFDLLRSVAPDVPTAVLGALTHADAFEGLADDPNFRLLPLELPPDEFQQQAERLMRPRSAARRQLHFQAFRVCGEHDSGSFEHPVVDLSNAGLSLAVPLDAPVASYVAGATFRSIRIVDEDGETRFSAPFAHVRNSKLDSSFPGAMLRVGLSFEQAIQPQRTHGNVIADPAQVLAVLRRLARTNSPVVVSPLDSDESYRLRIGEIPSGMGLEPTLTLEPRPQHVKTYDVVRLSFDHHGLSYSGLSPVLKVASGLELAPPRTLRVHHRRESNRHRPTSGRPYIVRLVSRLAGLDQRFPVHDLNATGLSAEVGLNEVVLPPGLILDRVELHLPDHAEPLVCRGVLRTLRRLPLELDRADSPGVTGTVLARCGIELLDLSSDERRRLSASLVAEGFPHIEVAREGEFDALWKFLADARFTFHLYADGSEESRRAAENSFGRTLGPARKIGIPLVYRSNDGLRGTMTGLRIYERSWLLTHLAVMQGGPAAPSARISRALCMGLIEHLENQPTAEYVKLMWKKDHRWSNRMAGWSGRSIHRPGFSEMREFGVLVRPTAMPVTPEPDPAIVIRPATDSELPQIEAELVRQVSLVRLRSEDLYGNGLRLRSVGSVYQSCGLERRREIRVAHSDGRLVGFSLVEQTTPALQLTEVLNSFEAFVCTGTEPELRQRVLRALVRHEILDSRERGQACTVALPEPSAYPAYMEAGFTEAGLARSWTWHRSQLRNWAEMWDQLYLRGDEFFKSGN